MLRAAADFFHGWVVRVPRNFGEIFCQFDKAARRSGARRNREICLEPFRTLRKFKRENVLVNKQPIFGQ